MSVISFEEARKRLGKTSSSRSQSKQIIPPAEPGQKLTNQQLDKIAAATGRVFLVIHKALEKGFKCKGQFARDNAIFVAAAAQMGTISTQIDDTQFGDTWWCTQDGLDWLKEMVTNAEEYFTDETPD